MIYVVEIQYYDTVSLTVRTAYYSTHGFSTKPGDTPASTPIENRVENPALIRRDIFDEGTTGGASKVGYGELVLRNDDGALDAFNNHGLDGRTLTVRYADNESVAYPAGFTTLFTGTMEQVECSEGTVRIQIRDRQVVASLPLQPTKYGGTNVLPDGVDGIETDLKGKPIPVLLGAAFNIEPQLVNTSRLIYQVRNGALRDVLATYDAGALLTPGADYASQSAMEATSPAAGEIRKWKAGGMYRLGSAPFGQVTCDALTGLTPSERTAGALYRTVLEAAGVSSGDISAADILALDTANNATLGLYYRDETTIAQVLDDIARSVGAWWGNDVLGKWRIQRLEAPVGPAVIAFSGDTNPKIVEGSLRRIPLNDGGLPAFRVTVRGVPNYTVQSSGLVGSVGAARRARLAQAYQVGIATDSAVQTAHVLAPELFVDTKLSCLGDVQAEATRLLALYSVKRDRFELTVNADAATLALIDLGVVVSITYTRFGLDAGKLFRILGYQLDPTAGTASLTVWG